MVVQKESSLIKQKFKQSSKFLNINDAKYIFNVNLTILELLNYLGFNKNLVVIDYNGIILEKKFWEQTYLYNNDSLEILSIAGGG